MATKMRGPSIVYEDDSLLVVQKPTKMHSIPLKSTTKKKDKGSLMEWVIQARPALAKMKGWHDNEKSILHRLDQETTGLLLFAKTNEAFQHLANQAKAQQIKKAYLVIATAVPAASCTVPEGVEKQEWWELLRNPGKLAASKKKYSVVSRFEKYGSMKVKPIFESSLNFAEKELAWYRTDLRVVKEEGPKYEDRVIVQAILSRGFRHQIRAHMAALGLPILNDLKYATTDLIQQGTTYHAHQDRPLGLFAVQLEFIHPQTQQNIIISLPTDNNYPLPYPLKFNK
eukprot:TRINITY_DN25958_c0_g1_i1.p1 TRINITY_DN25958_c0_g1~~TRINITY_DN25958_c0_g1_i1.p1  ORF type:complete len:296 (-),score=79.44 TRINITY_DN25958_c0_g1_i1:4-855(-)